MRALNNEVLKRLDLRRAIREEAEAWQSLVPKTPGIEAIVDNDRFRSWLEGQLRAGLAPAVPVVANARKASNGVRPVPIVALPERITYRALSRLLVADDRLVDRSPSRYLEFVLGPINFVREVEKPTGLAEVFVRSQTVQYVVKSDIAAFYEYVDHGILAEELLAATGEFDVIECLVGLLGDIQGRAFGLPQLLDPSDWLSEIYIDRVERAMIRSGWPTWRFNDDFRIACSDYASALRAIEELASHSREHGLTLGDHKTVTPKFSTYVWDTLGLQVDGGLPAQLAEHEPEDFVADYTDGIDEGDNSLAVLAVLGTAIDPPDDDEFSDVMNLASLNSSDFRKLRRALARLEANPDAIVLSRLTDIVRFVPALTPWVVRLLIAVNPTDRQGCSAVLRDLVGHASLTGWQQVWIVRAIDELGLLADEEGSVELTEFVVGHLDGRHDPLAQAEATLALSTIGRVEFTDVERMHHNAPSTLAPWYLVAVLRLHQRGLATDTEVAAVRQDDGLAAAILA